MTSNADRSPRERTPIRVLQYTYGGQHVSGIDTYLLEIYRAIDKSRVQFDFLFRYEIPYSSDVVRELELAGATVRALGIKEELNPLVRQVQEATRLRREFANTRTNVVEVNMTAVFMCLAALVPARVARVRTRIVHAHDAVKHEARAKRVLKQLFTPVLNALTTDRWACSKDAAIYLFGEKATAGGRWALIPNVVDAERFEFSDSARRDLRESWSADDRYCIGMIGRFTSQKNHARALQIFSVAAKQDPRLLLIIVGDGELRAKSERLARELGILESTRFLGARGDVDRILSAIDVLFAPSLHEGYPIVALEAQASGLPMVVSDAFPEETNISGRVSFVGLEQPDAVWASHLLKDPQKNRQLGAELVRTAGFDRVSAAKALADRYTNFEKARG